LAIRKNSIRRELTAFFRERDCFTLIRPVDDEDKLQDISKLSDSELRPRFVELSNDLRTKVFCAAKRKTFKGKPCSPSMFIELCEHFCNSINSGGLPEIESSWEMICKSEAARIEKSKLKS
jgi:hypothetical protein